MSKHILDRSHAPSGGRLVRFIALQRAEHPHRTTRALQQRPAAPKPPRFALYARLGRMAEA